MTQRLTPIPAHTPSASRHYFPKRYAPHEMDRTFTLDEANALARLPLACICREYPNAPGLTLNSADDLKTPRQLHPSFYGCLDWHSAVHGHWMLVRLLKEFRLPVEGQARAMLRQNLSAENIQAETAYFEHPNRRSFERTYGWAWLLKLAEELHGWDDPDGRTWSENLRPLEDRLVKSFLEFLPKQTYPIRSGTHANTAFGLAFAHDYALAVGNAPLRDLIRERAMTYFARDTNYPAGLEPNGADFFSPCLMEADLMRRVMQPADFRRWLRLYLPDLPNGEPKNLLTTAIVSDRSDPQIAHLDGLNLTRAWCLNGIASNLEPNDPARSVLLTAANTHAKEGLANVASGHYEGEHWLASFAVYLLIDSPLP